MPVAKLYDVTVQRRGKDDGGADGFGWRGARVANCSGSDIALFDDALGPVGHTSKWAAG